MPGAVQRGGGSFLRAIAEALIMFGAEAAAKDELFASSADTPTVLINACLAGVQAAGASVS